MNICMSTFKTISLDNFNGPTLCDMILFQPYNFSNLYNCAEIDMSSKTFLVLLTAYKELLNELLLVWWRNKYAN